MLSPQRENNLHAAKHMGHYIIFESVTGFPVTLVLFASGEFIRLSSLADGPAPDPAKRETSFLLDAPPSDPFPSISLGLRSHFGAVG